MASLTVNTNTLRTEASVVAAIARIADNNATEDELYSALKIFRETSRWSEAHAALKQIEGKLKNKDDLRFKLELCRTIAVEGGGIEEAIRLYEDLKKAHPTNSHVLRGYSEVLVQKGDYETALEVICQAPVDDPMKFDAVFRAVRLSVYIAARNQRAALLKTNSTLPYMGAVLIMMIRDEADIVGDNLEHHYSF